MKKNVAVFLDRDGTINEEAGYLDELAKIKIISPAFEAIRFIKCYDMKAVVITNQAGVARGLFSEEFVNTANEYLRAALRQKDAIIATCY